MRQGLLVCQLQLGNGISVGNNVHVLSGQIIIFHKPELRPFGDHFPY